VWLLELFAQLDALLPPSIHAGLAFGVGRGRAVKCFHDDCDYEHRAMAQQGKGADQSRYSDVSSHSAFHNLETGRAISGQPLDGLQRLVDVSRHRRYPVCDPVYHLLGRNPS
jgi:hypothetical protein